jgi:hypothetical protein
MGKGLRLRRKGGFPSLTFPLPCLLRDVVAVNYGYGMACDTIRFAYSMPKQYWDIE